jgi:Domain of unknown function (DUF4383)
MLQESTSKWTANRITALVIGIIFALIGIIGFFTPTENATGVRAVFGIFDVDTLHSIINLVVGLLGIASAFTGQSHTFNRIFGIVFVLFGLLGLIPALYFPSGSYGTDNGLFLSLVHDNAGDHILHLITGIAALVVAYYAVGFGRRRLAS